MWPRVEDEGLVDGSMWPLMQTRDWAVKAAASSRLEHSVASSAGPRVKAEDVPQAAKNDSRDYRLMGLLE